MNCSRHLPPIAWRLARAAISLFAIVAFAIVAPAELRHLVQHGECEEEAEHRLPCQPCAQFQQLLQIEPAAPAVPPVAGTAATVEPAASLNTGSPGSIALASRSPPRS